MYITVNINPAIRQISWDDILNGNVTEEDFVEKRGRTYTRYVTEIPEKIKRGYSSWADSAHEVVCAFNAKYETMIEDTDRHKYFRTFFIPKRKGGLRQIDAPNDELAIALTEARHILENKFFAPHHTSAYAYVKGRCNVDAVKVSQANNSKWFLKLDMKGFFPSTTFKFATDMIYQSFPFCYYIERYGREEIDKMFSLAFLDDSLPQGTQISPLITNMMMIPIDHYIARYAREAKPYMTYVRYADDICLSSRAKFDPEKVIEKIKWILNQFNAPFRLNDEKTVFGNSNGKNFMLGVMLNKDNKITVGHGRKKILKHMLHNFGEDVKNNRTWTVEDVQHLAGVISYYKMVEGNVINELIKTYSEKTGTDINTAMKTILKGE